MYDFDIKVERRETSSIKWDSTEQFIGKAGLMPFWVADMDFESPEAVIEVLRKRADHGVFGYTANNASALEAFQAWTVKRHDLELPAEWLVRSPGVVTALGLAIQAFTDEGDGILIQPPVYPPFAEMTTINGRRVIKNPLDLSGSRAEINFAHLEEVIREEHPAMMIFCNPHNPVGRVWSQEEVARVTEICQRYGVFLFSDEIHSDLTFSGQRFYSALNVAGADRSMIMTAMAPSKTFNIAGLFYSLIIIPDEDRRKRFNRVIDRLHLMPVNCFNESAAKAAYLHGEAWLDELLVYLEENYRLLDGYIKEKMPEVRLLKMEGTYLAWLDFRNLFQSGKELKRFMVDRAGVAVNDGRAFGEEGEGYVRFNFGCPREQMLEGLERIREALAARMTE